MRPYNYRITNCNLDVAGPELGCKAVRLPGANRGAGVRFSGGSADPAALGTALSAALFETFDEAAYDAFAAL